MTRGEGKDEEKEKEEEGEEEKIIAIFQLTYVN